jgi:3-hydroxyacyl-[acyl-carrier-protein] dehydratase
MVLDFEGVKRLLPQSYPFIFIDRVLEFEARRRIVCLKNVTGNEAFFAGHFPEMAIMPGALMGEGIAQASIILFRLSEEGSPETGGRIFLVGTTRTRFIQPVVPGDSLRITVEVLKLFSKSAMVKGIAEVDGCTVVKSTITLAAILPEELRAGPRPRDRELEMRSAIP